MNALTALMIGWGVFWLLIWSGLYAVFSYLRRDTGGAALDPLASHHNDAEAALGCWVMALVALFWIMAWATVRSVAA